MSMRNHHDPSAPLMEWWTAHGAGKLLALPSEVPWPRSLAVRSALLNAQQAMLLGFVVNISTKASVWS